MDFSKFKTSDWLKVGGGVLMLISGFLAWGKLSFAGFTGYSGNAFDFFFRGTIPWLLVVAVGVVSFLLVQGTLKPGSFPWPLVMLAASALSTILVLIFVINPTKDGVDLDLGFGAILGLIAAAAALAGSFLGFKESGGNLADLKDPNKLKGAFGAGGGNTPPPPPPPAN